MSFYSNTDKDNVPVSVYWCCCSLSSSLVVVMTPVTGLIMKPSSVTPPYVTWPFDPVCKTQIRHRKIRLVLPAIIHPDCVVWGRN